MRRFLPLIATLLAASPLTAHSQDLWPTKQWTVASPRAVGFDSTILAGLDAEIASGKYGYVDGMLVIRHGKVAYERSYKHDYDSIYGADARTPSPLNAHDPSGPFNYFNPWWHPFYRRGELHSLQSVTKTIVSVIIGVATTRGDFPSLDTPILTFFDTAHVANIDPRKRHVTIRHLLTMTAGLDWNENLPYSDPNNAASQMEASADWIKFTIDRPMAEEPGTSFNYSSGVSELLSHIFRVATGRDIEEYAARNLFTPLGIQDWFWKRSPTGLADTEGGLYLKPRDLAKIWYLYLKNGSWEGKQIVQPEWVRASVTPAVTVSNRGPNVKYGLKWWLVPYGDGSHLAWAGSGFGGQLPIAVPEQDLVMVFTAWNIVGGRPALNRQMALERVLAAVVSK
ncbi:MAG: serine hydrolase [Gemmatimonadetes bacterium]|nr:serine hydrolase [Gemmatimonadota bacterium]